MGDVVWRVACGTVQRWPGGSMRQRVIEIQIKCNMMWIWNSKQHAAINYWCGYIYWTSKMHKQCHPFLCRFFFCASARTEQLWLWYFRWNLNANAECSLLSSQKFPSLKTELQQIYFPDELTQTNDSAACGPAPSLSTLELNCIFLIEFKIPRGLVICPNIWNNVMQNVAFTKSLCPIILVCAPDASMLKYARYFFPISLAVDGCLNLNHVKAVTYDLTGVNVLVLNH